MKRKFVDFILVVGLLITVASAFAHTWQQTTTAVGLLTGMSADGKIICIVNSGTHPVVSTDSGKAWTVATSSPPFSAGRVGSIAISADGGKMFAGLRTNNGSIISILISTNQGATWTQTGFPSITSPTNYAVACSADGSKVITTALGNDSIFYSTNGGINCYTSSLPTAVGSLASSADGSRMLAAASVGFYTSQDFGVTWTPGNTPLSHIIAVCMSCDGKWIGALGSETYISSDSGVTWRTNQITGVTIACSANGTNWIIAGNQIYTSVDAGVTWQTNFSVAQWLGGLVSADGDEMAAIGSGQGTLIGRLTPTPQLNIQPKNSAIGLSWLLPSTNFVLQQSTDPAAISWTAVTNSPTLNFTNLNQELNLPTTTTNTFFRLMAQ